MNHGEIVSFLWGVADLIRDTFRRSKYEDVILPLTVLRRLDCVLAPTKEKVRRRQVELRGRVSKRQHQGDRMGRPERRDDAKRRRRRCMPSVRIVGV